MSADLPPVPPAVVEFAQQNGCVTPVLNYTWQEPYRTFKDFKVYNTKKQDDTINTYYIFILVNGDNIRFATEEEEKELRKIIWL